MNENQKGVPRVKDLYWGTDRERLLRGDLDEIRWRIPYLIAAHALRRLIRAVREIEAKHLETGLTGSRVGAERDAELAEAALARLSEIANWLTASGPRDDQ